MSGGKKTQFPLIIFFSLVFMPVLFVYAQSKYSETISALQKAYMSEMQAHHNYMAYAERQNRKIIPILLTFSFHLALPNQSMPIT